MKTELNQEEFAKLLARGDLAVVFQWLDKKLINTPPNIEMVNLIAQSCIKQKNIQVLGYLIDKIKGPNDQKRVVCEYLDPCQLEESLESIDCFKVLWPYFMNPSNDGLNALKEAARHGKYEILSYVKTVCEKQWEQEYNHYMLAGLCMPVSNRLWGELDDKWLKECLEKYKSDMEKWEKMQAGILCFGFAGGEVKILEKLKEHGCHFNDEKLIIGVDNKKSKMARGSFEAFMWGLKNIRLEASEYPALIIKVLYKLGNDAQTEKKINYWLKNNMILFTSQKEALYIFNVSYAFILKQGQDKSRVDLFKDFIGNWLEQVLDNKGFEGLRVLEQLDEKKDISKDQWQKLLMQTNKGTENIKKLAEQVKKIKEERFKNKELAAALIELVGNEHTLTALSQVVDQGDGQEAIPKAMKRGL